MRTISIDEAIQEIRERDGKVAFFLGAGISKREPSGLLDSRKFKSLLVSRIIDSALCTHITSDDKILDSIIKLPQEQILQWLVETIGRQGIDILKVFESETYNENHFICASLTKMKLVNILLTTNFDQLLEYAFKEVFNTDVFVAKEENEFIFREGSQIFKLHGSVENIIMANAIITDVSKSLPPQKNKLLCSILQNYLVFFIGYSGNDPDIQNVLLKQKNHNIIWVLRPNSSNLMLRNLVTQMNCRVIELDLNQFFDLLMSHFQITLPKSIFNSNPKKDYEGLFNNWAIRYPAYTLSLLGGNLLARAGFYTDAQKAFNEGIRLVDKAGKPPEDVPQLSETKDWKKIVSAQFYGSLGAVSMQIGDFITALQHLNEAITAYDVENLDQTGLPAGFITTVANIAESYHRLGDMEKAMTTATWALKLARAINEKRLIAQILGNLALIYQDQNMLQKSLECVKEALETIEAIGDLYCEAELLYTKGCILHQSADYLSALKHYVSAAEKLSFYSEPERTHGFFRDIGITLIELNRPQQALQFLNKAYASVVIDGLEESQVATQLLINIGLAKRSLKRQEIISGPLPEYIEYFANAFRISEKKGYAYLLAHAYANVGMGYFMANDFQTAKRYFQKALDVYISLKDHKFILYTSQQLVGCSLYSDNISDSWNIISFLKKTGEKTGVQEYHMIAQSLSESTARNLEINEVVCRLNHLNL